MPSRVIHRAIFMGDDERLRRALTKAYQGLPVKIAAIGGSITFGMGAGIHGDKHPIYVERLRDWVNDAWPHGNVSVVNGGIPAITSSYMSLCCNLHCPMDSDIIIIDLAANDPSTFHDDRPFGKVPERAAFERLIRRLLGRPSRPAVILINAFQHPNNLPEDKRGVAYLMNSEAYFMEVATYYGLSSASLKGATHRLSQNRVPGFWMNLSQHQIMVANGDMTKNSSDPGLKYFFWDSLHISGANGHRLMYELLVGVLLKASRGLVSRPRQEGGPEDVRVDAPLPQPLIQGNFEAARESCLSGEKLRLAAISRQGFAWVNEAHDTSNALKPPKWGWTALDPGSELLLNISTACSTYDVSNVVASTNTTVSLGFLGSFKNMGMASVSCASGCECVPVQLQGHKPERQVSVLHITQITVTQHLECILRVKVLNETKSQGGHKVKIGVLIVGESSLQDENFRDSAEQIEIGASLFTHSSMIPCSALHALRQSLCCSSL